MSYAEIAAKGPKQTPEEAAAPLPPQIEVDGTESTSTASLIDVDTPSVHTVPSDFQEQEIKTETQATRVEKEEEQEAKEEAEKIKAKARAEADLAKKKAKSKAKKADNWLTKQFASLSDGTTGALAAVNLFAVVGLSGWLGYRAWGLYDRRQFTWQHAGRGAGILAAVAVFESVFSGYLAKGKKAKGQ
ncbi:hypothetical protein SMACR_05635 [Sordaria macrospora]|uniref:Mitochondrial outer membrane protein OM14 C-terminal domain-containing protein n=1 Tax=Sordaria macrospora TaxID=5147 RepID=A0A8S8ZIN9_SORMA|nr:hypothetical protein SMACR_05635 [Sordaria macrospora]KAH7625537.1 hypothetical protein B0T09DRAFT_65117 [Sordaria sp. MPI-SDFR-AT-0083]WPJ62494.1 hypothetical protein SMAC4_05635 [Sordaria macrospora]